MRLLACFSLTLIAIVAFVSATNSTWGSYDKRDRPFHIQNVTIQGHFSFTPIFNLTYPLNLGTQKSKINYIEILDRSPTGDGGLVNIHAGGVHFNHVTILVMSECINGINITAQIWGR